MPPLKYLLQPAPHHNFALCSSNSEDMYGAAAVILERFADDLLYKCEIFMNDDFRKNEFRKMVDLFNLKSSMNRSSTSGKTYEQIRSDYARWKAVSEMAKKQTKENTEDGSVC